MNSPEGENIIWLDYCGYPICDNQQDLTIAQNIFISKGRMNLYKEMNKVEDKPKLRR